MSDQIEIVEDNSNCSSSLDDEFSEDEFDEFEELEETNKLLNDLSKDLKTKAIENINFNSYFDKIDEEYVKSRFVKYIKDFIDNYHDESNEPFNYIENDIIFRIAVILGILETKNKDYLPESKNGYIEFPNNDLSRDDSFKDFSNFDQKDYISHTFNNYYVLNINNLRIEIPKFSNIRFSGILIDHDEYLSDDFKLTHTEEKNYNYYNNYNHYFSLVYTKSFDKSLFKPPKYLIRIENLKFMNSTNDFPLLKILPKIFSKNYESKEFEDLLTSEINSLLLTISEYKLPTFSKFSLEGLNFQKFKDGIELKKQELNNSIEELNLKNNSIEKLISTNLKLNEELEIQIKNKEIQIYNLNKQIDDLEQTYKSFKRFEDFQGFFEDTSVSEYQKLKQVEHDFQEYQRRSDEMKVYDEIIQNFELYRNNFLIKSREYSKLMKKHFLEKKEKLNSRREELEAIFEEDHEKMRKKYKQKKIELELDYKQKKIDLELDYKQKSENLEKAINDANDKQKYWQNIIDHAEDHITSKLQKQLQEQINQFSKFNSTKWDSQVRFNIISTILKSINHKNDLIKLGIKTDELEFKNLNEVLKCIQIFNMFGLCTNDKNENILMNKFTFNFIDKINSYMKQFSVLDPDYKK